MANDQNKKFQEFLQREKRKSLFYSILFFAAVIVVIIFSALNIKYKNQLKEDKKTIEAQKDTIFQLVEAYKKYSGFQENTTDSLREIISLYTRTLEDLKSEINVAQTNTSKIKENWNRIDAVQTELTAKKFYNLTNLNNYKVGYYFLPEDEQIARQLLEHMKLNGFEGNYEFYPKDMKFFAKVDPPRGYEIRYESKTEDAEAFELKSIVDTWNSNIKFDLRPVRTPTPNFVSIFIPNKKVQISSQIETTQMEQMKKGN